MNQKLPHSNSVLSMLLNWCASQYITPPPGNPPTQGKLTTGFGRKTLATVGAAPRIVIVRSRARFEGPVKNYGLQAPPDANDLNYSGPATSPTNRALRTRWATFEAHLWGETRPSDPPGDEGSSGTEDLITVLNQGLYILAHGAYQLEEEIWDGDEGWESQGALALLRFSLALPLLDVVGAIALAQVNSVKVTNTLTPTPPSTLPAFTEGPWTIPP